MLSTSISGVLFELITILQAFTQVSALPTSTTATNTSAQLETRQALDSNRNSNNNNYRNSNDNNLAPPNNTAASK